MVVVCMVWSQKSRWFGYVFIVWLFVCLFVVVVPDWNGEASGHFTKGDNVDMIGLQ